MKKNLKMLDFTKLMTTKELVIYSFEGLAIVFTFAYFFYKSFIWGLILCPFTIVFLNMKSEELFRAKQWDILVQFKEMIISLNSSLQAGYSIEMAFEVALADMRDMYGNDSYITYDLSQIIKGLNNNIPIASLLGGMAQRNGLEEMESFANIMATYKQTGGNIVEIIQTYVSIIEDKVSLRQEIETAISSKKYEQRIMNVVPFVILFYINLSNRGFFDVLYHNIFGNIVMTIVMIIYLVSVYWSNKIINNIM